MHPWVNLQSMLEKCLVGSLVQNQVPEEKPLTSSTTSLKSIKRTSLDVAMASKPVPFLNNISKEVPVLDSYQTIETVHIVLYTKCKNLRDDCLIIDKIDENNPNNVVLFVYTPNDVYKYDLGKQNIICTASNFRSSVCFQVDFNSDIRDSGSKNVQKKALIVSKPDSGHQVDLNLL